MRIIKAAGLMFGGGAGVLFLSAPFGGIGVCGPTTSFGGMLFFIGLIGLLGGPLVGLGGLIVAGIRSLRH